MAASPHPTNPFRPTLFRFLTDLAANNRRDWFEANRERRFLCQAVEAPF